MRITVNLLSTLVLSALTSHTAVTLVTHKVAKDITGAESTALSTSGYNSTAGNTIVVWTASFSGAQPIGLVTDSAGDTFTPATLRKGTWFGQWFYAKNVKGEGFNVVTIHPAITGRATLTYPAMSVMEFSGVDANAPIALESAGPQGALSAWTSEPFNVPAGGVALLGIVTANGGAYTAGQGFKIEDSYQTTASSKYSFASLDQSFPEAKQGVTASVSWTGTLQATGSVIVLKPAS